MTPLKIFSIRHDSTQLNTVSVKFENSWIPFSWFFPWSEMLVGYKEKQPSMTRGSTAGSSEQSTLVPNSTPFVLCFLDLFILGNKGTNLLLSTKKTPQIFVLYYRIIKTPTPHPTCNVDSTRKTRNHAWHAAIRVTFVVCFGYVLRKAMTLLFFWEPANVILIKKNLSGSHTLKARTWSGNFA